MRLYGERTNTVRLVPELWRPPHNRHIISERAISVPHLDGVRGVNRVRPACASHCIYENYPPWVTLRRLARAARLRWQLDTTSIALPERLPVIRRAPTIGGAAPTLIAHDGQTGPGAEITLFRA